MVWIYYVNMHPRNQADRDICYLISIGRINRRVADMHWFHSKDWLPIPHMITKTNCTFKMTQPLGMGVLQPDKI